MLLTLNIFQQEKSGKKDNDKQYENKLYNYIIILLFYIIIYYINIIIYNYPSLVISLINIDFASLKL